jgi:hypothetical protein
MTSVKPKETRYLAGFFVPDRSSSFEAFPWQPAVFNSNFCSNSQRASAVPRQVMPLTKTAIGNALAGEEKKRRLRRPIPPDSVGRSSSMAELAERFPDRGFDKLFQLIRRRGLIWNHKRVWRVYCLMQLNRRRRGKKRKAIRSEP